MFPTLALIFFLRRREPQSKTEVVVKKNFQVSRISRHLPHWGDLTRYAQQAGKDALKTFDGYKASNFHREAQDVLL